MCFINLKLFYNKFVRTSLRILTGWLVHVSYVGRLSATHTSPILVLSFGGGVVQCQCPHLSSNDTIDNKFIGDFHTMSFSILSRKHLFLSQYIANFLNGRN